MPTDILPVDPNVKLPPTIARQVAAADSLHQQAYKTDPPAQPDPPVADPPAPPVTGAVTDPPAPPEPARGSVPDTGEPGSWEHRYHSMKGRYDQSQVVIGQMQEQMSQIGDELVRLQQAYQDRAAPPRSDTKTPAPTHVRLTEADVQAYGPELVDLIRRAALDAVQPEIDKTSNQVRQVSQRVQQSSELTLYQTLDRDIPTWREVNTNPRFKVWCGLPDVYSGQVRGKLLNAAFKAADAPRVVAFFKGFLAEEVATGQLPDPAAPPAGQEPPVRQAAVALESLTAPGRAKPAPGEGPGPSADKPIYTRAQVQNFYTAVRQGRYVGRDADKLRDETAIFAAQREGRIRG